VASLRSARLRRGVLTARGTARGACGVRAVEVAVYRRLAGGRCRFLRADGRLGGSLPCSSTVALVATGTTRWSLRIRTRVSPDRLRIYSRAIDVAGRRQPAVRRAAIGRAS
jgi:hypothetical protein